LCKRQVTVLRLWIPASISFASPVAAAYHEDLGQRTITLIGCHNVDNTCFIILDGPGFGVNQGCVDSGTGVRWDNGDTSEGKRTYATFLAAYLAGKKVDIQRFQYQLITLFKP